ncbi:aminotransferase class I/II-fold pyridoxal phosphate-dependent enzyme [Catellatospora bangladeshensis]|uniref:Valine--pyruvate transaminase n=1 Tax=Catellatospora bangladeshensis TaxID=310355 RepID=A0A8J3NMA0_9ACTN|nr:aminotransferase class I/II-fold pyridoxal phosphate-dependent enzyme [Catellatospora bangladeshensis]GIF84868.1 valine--pyruvate transaminase [Catellatospora bangladeshensis]
MVLSLSGTKMAHASGIRSIMEDIATSMRGASTGSLLNLSIGNPAPIPEVVGTWRRLFDETLDASFARASCLYGPSRGTDDLVAAIVEYFSGRYGWPLTPEHVVVGSGSQMLSFVASAVFTGPGAARDTKTVLPALPDYTGYQGVYLFPGGVAGIAPRIELCGDRRFRYHLDPDALRRSDDIGLLLLSSPSNPTGRCVSPQELDALLEIAADRDVPIFFDHAYGAPFPQIVETPEPPRWHENIINVFTVSKAGLPGERIGFAVGDPRFIEPMVSFVANSTLHAGQLAQQVTARALATGELDRLTAEVIRPYYAHKRRLGEKLLADILPADVNWRLHAGTSGGMFCWVWVDEPWFDDRALYARAKEKGVFLVPGRPFFTGEVAPAGFGRHDGRCFRISLSADEPVLTEGLERIAAALGELRDAG